MNDRGADDDRLALGRSTAQERLPSQAQGGAFTWLLALAQAVRWVGRRAVRAVRSLGR